MQKSGWVGLVLMFVVCVGGAAVEEPECEDSNGDAIVCWRSPEAPSSAV